MFKKNSRIDDKSSKKTATEGFLIIPECNTLNIPADIMDSMKKDIIRVLSKHLEINESEICIGLHKKPLLADTNAAAKVLTASIPIKFQP